MPYELRPSYVWESILNREKDVEELAVGKRVTDQGQTDMLL